MDLHLHDKVELKKAHPCGSTQWESRAGGHGYQAAVLRLRP